MTRVLIVDDQMSFRRQLRKLLKYAGFDDVVEANGVLEAEAQLQKCKVDLAIVDVMMPGISGLEGVPRLKEIDPDLRVVLVSAHRDYAHVFQKAAKEVDAEMFIPKDELDIQLVRSWQSPIRAVQGGDK